MTLEIWQMSISSYIENIELRTVRCLVYKKSGHVMIVIGASLLAIDYRIPIRQKLNVWH